MLSAPAEGFVLDLLCDRRKATRLGWLEQRGAAWCAAVEFFCAAMGDAYHEAASEKLPTAKTVVEHVPVSKNLHEALSKTRRTIQNQAAEEVNAPSKAHVGCCSNRRMNSAKRLALNWSRA